MQVHPAPGTVLMYLWWFGAQSSSGVCDWYKEHKELKYVA